MYGNTVKSANIAARSSFLPIEKRVLAKYRGICGVYWNWWFMSNSVELYIRSNFANNNPPSLTAPFPNHGS